MQVKPARVTLLLGVRVPFTVKLPGFGMTRRHAEEIVVCL